MKAIAEAIMVVHMTHRPAGLPSGTVGIKKRFLKVSKIPMTSTTDDISDAGIVRWRNIAAANMIKNDLHL